MERHCAGLKMFGYLDDFLLVSKIADSSFEHMSFFRRLCRDLGFPLAEEKTVGPVIKKKG